MSRKMMPASRPSLVPLKIFELLLVLYVFFGLGVWEMRLGWEHPDYAGWTASGAILMAGMSVCAWLLWHRRGAQEGVLLPIMFTMQAANFAQGILEWLAKEEGAKWPTMQFALCLLFLVLIIWSETNRRKEAAKDAALESKIFDMEDSL